MQLFQLCALLALSAWQATVVSAGDWSPKLYSRAFKGVSDCIYLDDTPVILIQDTDVVYQSDDNGKSWNPAKLEPASPDKPAPRPIKIQQVDFDNKMAFILTGTARQYYTLDQGASWKYFTLPESSYTDGSVQVNYANHDQMIFRFTHCSNNKKASQSVCKDYYYYTKDGLRSDPVAIEVEGLASCTFANENKNFKASDDSLVVCVRQTLDSFGFPQTSEIVGSKDFFKTVLTVKNQDMANAKVLAVKVMDSFLVATVATDWYSQESDVDLYVSKDGTEFHRAYFGERLRSWAYKLLPSTRNSLHIGVFSASGSKDPNRTVDIYKSDSEGRYFYKIFSNVISMYDAVTVLNKIQGIDGAWIAGYSNGIDADTFDPYAKSKITLDDGETWRYLGSLDDESCNTEECSVNLLWITERTGDGKTVTGPSPGILMGIGATGRYLPQDYSNLKTFLSRDGGITWKKVADQPSVFATTDQGNIVVMLPMDFTPKEGEDKNKLTSKMQFSLDQGATWTEVDLGVNIFPLIISTAKDGTSHQLTLIGFRVDHSDDQASVAITIDFDDAYKGKKCGKGDFEEWYARVDPETQVPTCVYGHKEKYNRRKQKAQCFASERYKDIEVIEEPCPCTLFDTECVPGFWMDDKRDCVPMSSILSSGICQGKKKKIKVTSRRMIPGDLCKGGDFKIPQNDHEVDCKKAHELSEMSKIVTKQSNMKEKVVYFSYLERDPENKGIPDETLLVVTESMTLFVSYDGGSSFTVPPALTKTKGQISNLFTNPYFPNNVYAVTKSGDVYFSTDRANSFDKFSTPYEINGDPKYDMTFSKGDANKFIWYAESDCDTLGNCRLRSAITEDNGKTFIHMLDDSRRCYFGNSIFNTKEHKIDPKLVVCEQKVGQKPFYQLISSVDYFATTPVVELEKIVGSTDSGEFLVAARINDDDSLTAFITVDGDNYAEAKFPKDIQVNKQTAYTVLRVNSEQVFLHVTTNADMGSEFGALLKSNYNGTLYVTSARDVNRNSEGFVDFESVQNLDGISLLNRVSNVKEVTKDRKEKKLKTYITFNDGGSWSTLRAPEKGSDGKKLSKCKGCSLNLHSYTERVDAARDTYSSGSALGMMFALGNVGKELKPLDDKDTALYFTEDAGVNWKEIAKGQYMWEFGDQGSLLVIVKAAAATNVLSYSLDFGASWEEYQFAADQYYVEDLATIPSDTATEFMILVRDDVGDSHIFTVDFSHLNSRQCKLNRNDKNEPTGDFQYWSPAAQNSKDQCLFGRHTRYVRRNPKVTDCFIGSAPIFKDTEASTPCECTREDFECDYNYELASDGTCRLVKGLKPEDRSLVCQVDDKAVEYWEPTGYRKVPLSKCEGGLTLDQWESHPCPGRKKQFHEKHGTGIHGFSLFMVIVVPLVAFLASAAFIYDKGIRRNGGLQRFGEIHLDDDDNLHLIEENQVDKVVNKVVRAGLYATSAVYSTFKKAKTFFQRSILRRRGVGGLDEESSTPFFNDRIIDNDNDDEDSLFRYQDDDDDAREIDSFLDNAIENDVGGDDDDAPEHPYQDDI